MRKLRKIRNSLRQNAALLQLTLRRKKNIVAAADEIDVVIPVVGKDLKILPLCLQGLRACVQHPVKNIYVVAPPQDEIVAFCKTNSLVFVDEATVLGFAPIALGLEIVRSGGQSVNRSGWLFQQFVKLSGSVGTCDNYLCIDADHVLLQPHVFLTTGRKPVFYMSGENHQAYYDCLRKLLGHVHLTPMSYVAHKMIFNREQVRSLQKMIEQHTGQPWQTAILANYDRREFCGFSEFETYGNFVREKVLLPWRQRSMNYAKIADYSALVNRYGHTCRAITFPDYYNR